MKLELELTATTMPNPFAASGANGYAPEKINEMLKAGIAAAKEGNRAEARALLLRVTEIQSDNETAWLWLASISEYPEELLVFLNNVLSINPHNERALEWSRATKSLLAKTFVQRGINASRENQKEFANQFFRQALAHDEANEMAWLWMASLADSDEEKISHLEKVLSFNPANETAQASLKAVRQQMSQSLLKKANVAAISGDHETARALLDELMNLSPEMEEAWILKAYLTEGHDEKIACFEKVLALNPENETARAGIDSLNAIKQRELERLAQKAELERLQAEVARAELEQAAKAENESEVVSGEEEIPEQLFFAKQVASKNQFESQEYPEFNFTGEDETEESSALTEENEPEIAIFTQDEPTQELEPEFVQNPAIQTAFKLPYQQESLELSDKAQEFSPEENAVEENFALLNDSEFVATTINEFETEEFGLEIEAEDTAQTEMTLGSADDEDFASVSKDFEMLSEEPVFAVTENYSDENAPQTDETDSQPNYFIPSEEPEENSVKEFSEYTDASEVVSSTQFGAPENDYFNSHSNGVADTAAEDEDVEEIYVAEDETLDNYFQSSLEDEENQPPQDEVEETDSAEQNDAYAAAAADDEKENEVSVAARAASFQMPVQTVSFECPFCAAENEQQAFVCTSCCAVLTLSDLEMLLSNQEADDELMQQAIERMEGEMLYRTYEADELTNLGIAHLNAKNLRQGHAYLMQASQMNPNNVILSGQVNTLAIRLDEIEQHESKTPEARCCTILVVDDSPTVRKLISGKLEKSGHTVILAVDGMDALAKINETVPDLVLLDITMPRMDGYQVCKLIRSNNITKDVPVVMISGKDGFFDKVRGRMAGTTGYITKPFGPDTLMRTIEAYLN